ncbi:LytTR family transcriptional regulator DNA-binding domain-containing protein [Cereibacter sphaeroides]|nr:LytTR family transcriptional regulator DNA-binding domain-containing protein [Cereibacter sphaeroides]
MVGDANNSAPLVSGDTGGTPLKLALREAQDFIFRRSFWWLHGAGIVMAAVAGPFHTMQNLTLQGRFLYWSIVILTLGVLITTVSIVARAINRDRMHWVPVIVLASLAVTPIGLAFVWLMNIVVIGLPADPPGLPLLSYVAVPMVLINLIVNASTEADRRELARRRDFESRFGARFETESHPPANDLVPALPEGSVMPLPAIEPLPEPTTDAVPLLFEKLPEELGQELICLRAQDHYVEATTTRGSDQVLMRLSDAERDLGRFDGMRVHRSWWVNLDHVTDMARTENGGTELTTTNGMVIPVSRGQKAALREALDERRKAAE